jgi:hypothetical protein
MGVVIGREGGLLFAYWKLMEMALLVKIHRV